MVVFALLTRGPQVRGAENLPKYNQPAVYVANHQSYLDIYSLFHLRRPFKVRLAAGSGRWCERG